MNGLESRFRTFGEIATELRARLGFVTQGSAAKANDTVIKSFLQEAHDYVFGELMPPAQRKKCAIRMQAGSYLYDWHNDAEDEPIDPAQVISVWLRVSDSIREPLAQGITEAERAFETLRQSPQRYDTINGQLEVWPAPDREYELLVEYTAPKARFDRASDRPSVPDRLVFLYALATAKAHYRHTDAEAAATAFQNMMAKTKSRQHEGRRYFVASADGASRDPQVARTAGGYSLRG